VLQAFREFRAAPTAPEDPAGLRDQPIHRDLEARAILEHPAIRVLQEDQEFPASSA
jgi:hypothetical protein